MDKQVGTILEARKSQSGKTLGIKIGNRWYQTKNWALENAVGREVEYDVGTSEWNGKTMFWANDAELISDHSPTGSGNSASSVATTQPATSRDRDASIIAQALTKACTAPGDPVETVWSRYCAFYDKAIGGEASKKVSEDFDDDIPF